MNGELDQKRLGDMVANLLNEGGKRLIRAAGPVVYYMDPNREGAEFITIAMSSMLLKYEVDLTRLMTEYGLDVECEAYDEITKEIADYYMKQDCDTVFYYGVEAFLVPMQHKMKFKFRGACYKSTEKKDGNVNNDL